MGTSRMSDERLALLLAAYDSERYTVQQIAEEFGVSPVTVTRYAKRAGIGARSGRSESPRVLDERTGAWVYGTDGIARWQFGARPKQFTGEAP